MHKMSSTTRLSVEPCGGANLMQLAEVPQKPRLLLFKSALSGNTRLGMNHAVNISHPYLAGVEAIELVPPHGRPDPYFVRHFRTSSESADESLLELLKHSSSSAPRIFWMSISFVDCAARPEQHHCSRNASSGAFTAKLTESIETFAQ
jgi:hypothetical protein